MPIFFAILLPIWFAALAVVLYFFLFTPKNPPLPVALVKIGSSTFRAELANSMLRRARGLMGRPALGEDEGMLFVLPFPSHSGFWMKGMLFPIDIIWIKSGRVVGFSELVPPQPGVPLWKLKSYFPPALSDTALEVAAGQVKKRGLRVGDAVFVQAPQP